MDSAWQTIAEISRVDLESYAEAFGATKETVELSLQSLPGIEILESDGKFLVLKTLKDFYPSHVSIFTSLSSEVSRRLKLNQGEVKNG